MDALVAVLLVAGLAAYLLVSHTLGVALWVVALLAGILGLVMPPRGRHWR